MSAQDKVKITALFKLWQTAYLAKKALDFKVHAAGLPAAQKKINNLLTITDPDDLVNALSEFRYVSDPVINTKWGKIQLDVPTHPLITALLMAGDCEDAALLVQAVRPGGQLFDCLELSRNGYVGHIIYRDGEDNVFSAASDKKNLVCDGKFTDITVIAKKYVKNWNYVVEFSPAIIIKSITER